MDKSLRDGFGWVRLGYWYEVERSQAREFQGGHEARNYLHSIAHEGMNLDTMRRFLSEMGEGLDLSRMSDDAVISYLAVQLGHGRLCLTNPSRLWSSASASAPVRPLPIARAPPAPTPAAPQAPSGAATPATPPRLHWRQVLGAEAESVLEAVLGRTRSAAEALGELGLEVAKRRLGFQDDPRFIHRYHGNDALGRDDKARLVGMEAKATSDDSTALTVRSDGSCQLSAQANRKTALRMLNEKRRKVGLPSGRQGGPYTRGEMELYEQLDAAKGRKRLVSSHTHTRTGRVRVFERNLEGDIDRNKRNPLDDFFLEGVEELQRMLLGSHAR